MSGNYLLDTSVIIDLFSEDGIVKDQLRKIGKPIPENDIWIAALTLQHNLSLATRDKHFENIEGLVIET